MLVRDGSAAGHLDWAGIVPRETIRRFECDCEQTRIKVDPNGDVVEVKTRRTFSARDRRLLHEGGWRLSRRPDGGLVAIPPWAPAR